MNKLMRVGELAKLVKVILRTVWYYESLGLISPGSVGAGQHRYPEQTVAASKAVPVWVKQGINGWMTAARIEDGRLLRSIRKGGKKIGTRLSDWAVWSVVEQSAKQMGIEHLGAHDLRRTCAKLCRKSGGDLEQIKFLLGHSSIQTTERYLDSEQEIATAVNDILGL